VNHAGAEAVPSVQGAELVCLECGQVSHAGAAGWKAYLGDWGDDEDVGVYCPDCAEREFGDRDAERRPGQ
jgi:hypothetical protein